MTGLFGTLGDLALVALGFSFLILAHEAGHFFAARWARVRVEAFAIGFGPAIVSWRKGLGLRRGTSAREYEKLPLNEKARSSPTEYRLNWLPFGGYVKMLGQDDMDPAKRSDLPDSYTSKPVWKRMVIISAGVVTNLALAGALFVVVFMIGMTTEPPVIGEVAPGSAGATAEVSSGWDAAEPGLRSGDRVLSVNGYAPSDFGDVALEVAMARRGNPVEIVVSRAGAPGPVTLVARPQVDRGTRLLDLGAFPAVSATIVGERLKAEADREVVRTDLRRAGIEDIGFGATLVEVNGEPASSGHELVGAFEASNGAPVLATFRTADGAMREAAIAPWARLETATAPLPASDGGKAPVEIGVPHLLGLTAPLEIGAANEEALKQGLRTGDIFARVGGVEWPTYPMAIAEIRRNAGRTVEIDVLRGGGIERVAARVGSDGRIGFLPMTAAQTRAIVAGTIGRGRTTGAPPTPGDALGLPPGSEIVEAAGVPVSNFTDLRAAILAGAAESMDIPLAVRLPLGDFGRGPVETMVWRLSAGDVEALRAAGWSSPMGTWLFEPATTVLVADGPIEAMAMGVHKTHRVMLNTYLTLVRLFEGSVRVEHLKGPVGIAHLGTRVVERGFIYLVFFMALISVNLAVINFLPLPIVDGGHMVFLAIEGLTGRPVGEGVQSAAALLGLLLVGAVFLVVTFNDVRALFGG